MNDDMLKEKTRIFETILQHTHMMVVLLDSDFNFIWVNKAYAETCGKEPSFFPGKNHFELYPNDENQAIFQKVVETGEPFFVTEKPFEFPDQPERGVTYWDWSLIPAKDMDSAVIGLVFTLIEVSDRIRAEIALKKSEAQYRELVQNTNSAIIRWKVDGTLIFFNEYAQKFFGYSKDEVLGRNVNILIPEEDSFGKDLKELGKDIVSNPEQYINNVNENILSDSTRVWMAWTNKPVLDENGNVVEILAVGTDITALKKAEIKIEASLKEKEILLKEIHHRVKNNMQIISSLVSLQANLLPESGPREILRNVSNRVHSMAMVHEKLYQSADLSSIDFAQYADNLMSYLWRSYVGTSGKIHLVKNLSPVSLSVDKAIPLGLILNELISNVLKHAFEGLKEGEVTVSLKEDENSRIVLSVCDNGKGLPANFDPDKPKSLGLRLVQMLAAQLHADVEVTGENGTEFKLILGRK